MAARQFVLSKETLTALSTPQLDRVAGGSYWCTLASVYWNGYCWEQ